MHLLWSRSLTNQNSLFWAEGWGSFIFVRCGSHGYQTCCLFGVDSSLLIEKRVQGRTWSRKKKRIRRLTRSSNQNLIVTCPNSTDQPNTGHLHGMRLVERGLTSWHEPDCSLLSTNQALSVSSAVGSRSNLFVYANPESITEERIRPCEKSIPHTYRRHPMLSCVDAAEN